MYNVHKIYFNPKQQSAMHLSFTNSMKLRLETIIALMIYNRNNSKVHDVEAEEIMKDPTRKKEWNQMYKSARKIAEEYIFNDLYKLDHVKERIHPLKSNTQYNHFHRFVTYIILHPHRSCNEDGRYGTIENISSFFNDIISKIPQTGNNSIRYVPHISFYANIYEQMDVELNASKEITLALEQAKYIRKTSAPNIKNVDALDNDPTTLLSFEDKKTSIEIFNRRRKKF